MAMLKLAKTAGHALRMGVLGTGALALAGCLSLGEDPPESLLTLTAEASAEAGAVATASPANPARAVAVQPIDTPAKLDVLRVPVAVTDTEIAYLQDAVWVEKPARLFRRLLGETMRARGGVLVIDNDDTPLLAAQSVRGTLTEMGYDALGQAVVVRFDAMRIASDGTVISRRFEARESGVAPEAAFVGPALNRAANRVAKDVSDWMVGG